MPDIERRKTVMSNLLYDGKTSEFIEMYRKNADLRKAACWVEEAASGGDVEAVRFLLQEGHSPAEISKGMYPKMALTAACRAGSAEIVKMLIEAGAPVVVRSDDDNPLFSAIYSRCLECVVLLVEAGIDLHHMGVNDEGNAFNALEYAEHWGCPDIADYLQSKGAVFPKTAGTETTTSSIVSVLAEQFGTEKPDSLGTFSLGSEYGQAELLVFDMGSADFPFRTVLTNGLAKHPIKTPAFDEEGSRIELIVHLPFTWPIEGEPQHDSAEYRWPFDWLRLLTRNILDGTITLPGTHLIISNDEPPQPLGAGSAQSCLLLVADFYPFFPIVANNSSPIHFYHVVPLYTEERTFEKGKGMQPLLEAMAEHGLQSLVIQPDREPFV